MLNFKRSQQKRGVVLDAQKIIKKLGENGVSKYRIAKTLKISWNSIRMWERGVFYPRKRNLEALSTLYMQVISCQKNS